MGFIQAAPGLLVSDQFTVSIPHPDPCWVIENPVGTEVLASSDFQLLVFSTEELLQSFMKAAEVYVLGGGIGPVRFTWDELVDKCGEQYTEAIIDHEGKAGYYQSAPLRKGI
ncbi:MAG: hypothetical protein WAW13_02930 [Minisyncoccia bacterium]